MTQRVEKYSQSLREQFSGEGPRRREAVSFDGRLSPFSVALAVALGDPEGGPDSTPASDDAEGRWRVDFDGGDELVFSEVGLSETGSSETGSSEIGSSETSGSSQVGGLDEFLLDAALERVASLDLNPLSAARDVLVLGDPLPAATSAHGLAWSLYSGAAVLLEKEPDLLLPAALWARPTIFFGRRDQVEALASALPEGARRPGRRHPLGRLRAIITVDQEDSPADPWQELGVSLTHLPA